MRRSLRRSSRLEAAGFRKPALQRQRQASPKMRPFPVTTTRTQRGRKGAAAQRHGEPDERGLGRLLGTIRSPKTPASEGGRYRGAPLWQVLAATQTGQHGLDVRSCVR